MLKFLGLNFEAMKSVKSYFANNIFGEFLATLTLSFCKIN